MSSAPVLSGAGTLLVVGLDVDDAMDAAYSGEAGYGAWLELSSALPYDTSSITLWLLNADGAGRFRLGLGAAASEVVVANDIPFYVNAGASSVTLPLAFPKGARLSFGIADATGVAVFATLTPAHPWAPVGYRYAVGINGWTAVSYDGGSYSSFINHTTNLGAGFKALMLAVAGASSLNQKAMVDFQYDGQTIGKLLYNATEFTLDPASYLIVHGAFSPGTTVRSRWKALNGTGSVAHALIGLG